MSRTIKFRAWDKATKLMFVIFDDGGENWFLPKWKSNYDVMQFTGLKDCNGVDIYDGDIVKALKHNEDSFTNEIVWRCGALWFGNWNWIEFQNIFRSIEVIGNKYEKGGE